MTTEMATALVERFFDIRPMGEWMSIARGKPVPGHLLGDLWREGEVAIMFADTGKGKSVLGVQMAEAIARGRRIAPFETTVKPAKVLYLDFELTEKQVEMRYTADHDPTKGGMLRRSYDFSKRFHRIELRPDHLLDCNGIPIEVAVRELIEPLAIVTGAKILIVDNITYLKRTADGTREAVPLMKELQRLKRRFGLSILVIAHTPKRDATRPLAVNDLQGSKVIANYADNIFAIGQSRRDASERYIKHIKLRSGELMYDEAHVPVYTLKKIGGNFLGFEHTGFAAEADLLRRPEARADAELIDEVKELHDAGMSVRKIAEKMGISKSAAHRYLQMLKPEKEDKDDVNVPKYDPKSNPYYFPGSEEYDAAKLKIREAGPIFDPNIESAFRGREHYLIGSARAAARKIYQKTGTAPPLADDVEYRNFKEAVRRYNESGGAIVGEPIAYVVGRFFPETTIVSELSDDRSSDEDTGDPPPEDPLARMKQAIDPYGRTRYIESEHPNGKPRLWYQYRSDGVLMRHQNDGFGTMIDIALRE